MRTNYVLIDHENVQPNILPSLGQTGCKVVVFVGANQTKMPFETVCALQKLGNQASYVKISGNGPNALDLHIAFYIGQISAQDPSVSFYIISKDTGFDPLVDHLKSKGILAKRFVSVADAPPLKAVKASPLAEKRAKIVTRLNSFGAAKPRSTKSLTSTIHTIFNKQISEAEAGALVKSLEKANLIKIDGTRIVYSLPERPTLAS